MLAFVAGAAAHAAIADAAPGTAGVVAALRTSGRPCPFHSCTAIATTAPQNASAAVA